jgi:hypothetical protein
VAPIIKHFIRGQSGWWECVTATDFDGPKGRVHVALGSRFFPETLFMGVDLAKLLDEEYEKAP